MAVITALVAVVMRACVLCCAGQCERVKVERQRSMEEVGGGAVVATAESCHRCHRCACILWWSTQEGGGREVEVDARGWK